MDIPYGETWSYSQLANHIGTPNAFVQLVPLMGLIQFRLLFHATEWLEVMVSHGFLEVDSKQKNSF
ncbi:MAG: hypothetical protein Ct9H90mP25_1600 [Gammaproteobacteria bacterium]|nr:MAG: hypothetical protein Ct9H90mP25_1600 [Gammaproteobacteria bacterium]